MRRRAFSTPARRRSSRARMRKLAGQDVGQLGPPQGHDAGCAAGAPDTDTDVSRHVAATRQPQRQLLRAVAEANLLDRRVAIALDDVDGEASGRTRSDDVSQAPKSARRQSRRGQRCAAPVNCALAARTSGMSKKCAISARHLVSRAHRTSLNALSSKRPTARRQAAPGHPRRARCGRRARRAPSSVSGRPPRHQTSVGRLDSRSAATALSMYVGLSPCSVTVLPATCAGGARIRSLREMRMPRTVPGVAEGLAASPPPTRAARRVRRRRRSRRARASRRASWLRPRQRCMQFAERHRLCPCGASQCPPPPASRLPEPDRPPAVPTRRLRRSGSASIVFAPTPRARA